MAEVVKGYVFKVHDPKPTKNPKFVLHSFSIEGDQRYFTTKFDEVPSKVKPGRYVKFAVEEDNSYGRTQYVVDVDSFKVTKAAPNGDKPTGKDPHAKSGGGGGGRGGKGGWKGDPAKDKYWKDREARDIRTGERLTMQGARTQAIEIAKFLQEQELLPKLKKAKVDAKVDVFMEIIDEITLQLIDKMDNFADSRLGDSASDDDGAKPAKKPGKKKPKDEDDFDDDDDDDDIDDDDDVADDDDDDDGDDWDD